MVDALKFRAGREVGHVTVAFGLPAGDAEHQLVAGDRPANRAEEAEAVMVADARLGFAGEIIRRPLGNDVDRTGDRVAAIERALRPAQHLDRKSTRLNSSHSCATRM